MAIDSPTEPLPEPPRKPSNRPADLRRVGVPSARRRWAVAATAMLIVALLTVTLGELMIRWLAPQRSLYPRTQYSRDYGFLPYADTEMVNEVPGRWRFVYRTNAQGHRGPLLPLSNRYLHPVVVLLGDSYTFGVGVDDGQEYAQPLRQALAGRFDVVNLGVEGWGLTQEIRRFYELGQLYQPAVVVLQFCANDPSDNLLNAVTEVQDGRFLFRPSSSGLESLKRFLSQSLLQRSQIYNLLREVGYGLWRGREVQAQMRVGAAAPGAQTPADEAGYIALLDLFAADLQRRGIRLVMFAVDGQLERFPALHDRVKSLHAQHRLHYVELMDWFAGTEIEKSPEGHWAASVHRTVAARLAVELVSGAGAGGVARAASPANP